MEDVLLTWVQSCPFVDNCTPCQLVDQIALSGARHAHHNNHPELLLVSESHFSCAVSMDEIPKNEAQCNNKAGFCTAQDHSCRSKPQAILRLPRAGHSERVALLNFRRRFSARPQMSTTPLQACMEEGLLVVQGCALVLSTAGGGGKPPWRFDTTNQHPSRPKPLHSVSVCFTGPFVI